MVRKRFIPDRGDLVWLDFNPVRGHEQSGRRPAFVLSTCEYNVISKLAIVCPVTSQIKGYPFEIQFKSKNISGAILADHIRNVDWIERNADKIGTVSETVIAEVQDYVKKLVLQS
ncbi:MAG: endoribonuclease MazF [bacterium]|nr:endoribonuclease MazF [bacterium]